MPRTENPFVVETENPFQVLLHSLMEQDMPSNNRPTYDSAYKSLQKTSNLTSREAELDRREAELQKREAELQKREDALKQRNDIQPPKEPNWPKCKPLVRHDIAEDIPEHGQPLVKRGFSAFWVSAICYTINMTANLAILATNAIENSGSGFIISLVMLFLGIPLSFISWYSSLYHGVRTESSLKFFWFFVPYGIHLIYCTFNCVGLGGSGGAGISITIAAFKNNIIAGIFCIISSVAWGAQVVYGSTLIVSARRFYKGKGMSKDNAQKELTLELAKNSHVQNAVKDQAKQQAKSSLRR